MSRQEILPTKDSPIDPYDIPKLRKAIGNLEYRLEFSPETSTTMTIIEHAAMNRQPPLLVALTDHQTQGMGREGRVWRDKPGSSVMFSALFIIDESAITPFADLVALQTCLALRATTGNAAIKIRYPNDIVFEGKKLGGLLVKNIYNQRRYLGTNTGIGINVHYQGSELKEYSTDYGATALDIITGSRNSRTEILINILEAIRNLGPDANVLTHNNNSPLKKRYGQWQEISSVQGQKIAIIQGNGDVFAQGVVKDVQVGRGILLKTGANEEKWITTFDTDMKVRTI